MQEDKIKMNAIISYLLVFVSWLFLLNKDNELINNSFVRSHVKSALFIHFLFFIVWLIFIYFGLFSSFSIFDFNLNEIISSFLFIIVFLYLLYGISEAHKWKTLEISDLFYFSSNKKLIDIDKDNNFDEKDILLYIMTYIPLIWFIVYGKNNLYKNKSFRSIIKMSFIVSFVCSILYISSFWSLSSLLLLAYFWFVAFSGIMLFSGTMFVIDLSRILDFRDIRLYIMTLFTYLLLFAKADFKWFNLVLESIKSKDEERLKNDLELFSSRKDLKAPKFLFYIPVLNLVFVFFLKTRYFNHIVNGIIISVLFILSWIIFWFANLYQVLLLFPIFYAIWFTHKLNFHLPIIFDIFLIFDYIFTVISSLFSFLKAKNKEEKTQSLKVLWEQKVESINSDFENRELWKSPLSEQK